MPAVRTQQALAENPMPDTEQASLPRVAANRTACPFPKCLATVSKPTDLERHYIVHFPEWYLPCFLLPIGPDRSERL